MCWKCKKETRVYTWKDHYNWTKEQPLVKPLPDTVRFLYSNMIGDSYWGNACEHCEATQGDWFIYNNGEGAFTDPYGVLEKRPEWFEQAGGWSGWGGIQCGNLLSGQTLSESEGPESVSAGSLCVPECPATDNGITN